MQSNTRLFFSDSAIELPKPDCESRLHSSSVCITFFVASIELSLPTFLQDTSPQIGKLQL